MNKIKVDLAEIAQIFDINDQETCPHLTDWLDTSIVLNDWEQKVFDITYKNIVTIAPFFIQINTFLYKKVQF